MRGREMTNADVIRNMNDHALYEFLSKFEIGDIDYSVTFCDMCEQDQRKGGKGNVFGYDCDDCRKAWLERDATEYNGLLYYEQK